jgi:hypothetical protein
MNEPTHEYVPEVGWKVFCPDCHCEIKTLTTVPHAEYECVAALKLENERLRNIIMNAGKYLAPWLPMPCNPAIGEILMEYYAAEPKAEAIKKAPPR